MTALGGTLLCAGAIATVWTFAFVACACVRGAQAIDDALDEVAHGDIPALPSCVELMGTLNTVRGGCAEVGAGRVHTNSNTLEA